MENFEEKKVAELSEIIETFPSSAEEIEKINNIKKASTEQRKSMVLYESLTIFFGQNPEAKNYVAFQMLASSSMYLDDLKNMAFDYLDKRILSFASKWAQENLN